MAISLGGALLLAVAGCLPWDDGTAAPDIAAPDIQVSELPAPDGETENANEAVLADLPEAATDANTPEAEAAPPERPDPERDACTREGGRMVAGPGGFGRLCVQPTPDAGRRCESAGDCTGHCLARGNVCAPLTPLMGCHDILLAGGERVTQCIE